MSEVLIDEILLKNIIAQRVLNELEINTLKSKNEETYYFKDISLYNSLLISSKSEDIFLDYELYFGFPKSFSCLIEGFYTTIDSEKAIFLPEIIISKINNGYFKNRDLSLVWINIIKDYLNIKLNTHSIEILKIKQIELINIIEDIKIKRFLFKKDPEILNEVINSLIIFKKSIQDIDIESNDLIILHDISMSFLNAEEIYSIFLKHFELDREENDILYNLFCRHI